MKRAITSVLIIILITACMFLPANEKLFAPVSFAEDSSLSESESPSPYLDVEGIYPDGRSDFVYNDNMLLHSSDSMSGDLCKASVVLAAAAYSSYNIQTILQNMGYSCTLYDYDQRTLDDNDKVAFAVGKKEFNGYTIYSIAIRGTTGLEWFSNFNIGHQEISGDVHTGFFLAAERVKQILTDLFTNDGATNSNRILWFSGHSRGAAVSNIVSRYFTENSDYASPAHIYSYNFACPAVEKQSIGYHNIFNFNNTGDMIPIVPLSEWGYSRNGIEKSRTFTANPAFCLRYYNKNTIPVRGYS